RRRLGRDAVACPAMGRMAKKIREEISPEVECNALKRPDSRVNKRVKSSAERVSNVCRTGAECRRTALESALLRGRPRLDARDGGQQPVCLRNWRRAPFSAMDLPLRAEGPIERLDRWFRRGEIRMLATSHAHVPDGAQNSLGLDKPPAETRVAVAMSGGVDSSVVAALLAAEGYDVV